MLEVLAFIFNNQTHLELFVERQSTHEGCEIFRTKIKEVCVSVQEVTIWKNLKQSIK